jgi:hypothetical protein
VIALVVWGVGLIAVGAPLWWLLHKLGFRHWLVAAATGTLLTFLAGFAILTRGFEMIPPPSGSALSAEDAGGPPVINNRLTPHGWRRAAQSSLMLAVAGALVALAVWRVAYRRVGSTG